MAGSVENVYARALLEIAAEDGSMKELDEELQALDGIFSANPQLTEILCAPTVTDAEKTDLIKKVFDGRISKVSYNFLCVLAEKKRVGYLTGIAQEFRKGYYEAAGIAEAEVTTAVPLKDDARNRLIAKLQKKYGKTRVFDTPITEIGIVGVGAAVLGNITIGDNSKIGGGAVAVKDVPPNCTVVGIPGRIVKRDGKRVTCEKSDAAKRMENLPDIVEEQHRSNCARIDHLEAQIAALRDEVCPEFKRAIADVPPVDVPEED